MKILGSFLMLTLIGCGQLKKTSSQTDSDTTSTAEESTSSFMDGMSEGIYDKFTCTITYDDNDKFSSVSFGEYKLSSSDSAQNNILSVYTIFNETVDTTVNVTVFDIEGTEYATTTFKLSGSLLDPKNVDIIFPNEVEISQQSTFKLE